MRLRALPVATLALALACADESPAPIPERETAVDPVARSLELAEAYVDAYYEQFPEEAYEAGYPDAPADRLSDRTPAARAAWEAREDSLLRALEAREVLVVGLEVPEGKKQVQRRVELTFELHRPGVLTPEVHQNPRRLRLLAGPSQLGLGDVHAGDGEEPAADVVDVHDPRGLEVQEDERVRREREEGRGRRGRGGRVLSLRAEDGRVRVDEPVAEDVVEARRADVLRRLDEDRLHLRGGERRIDGADQRGDALTVAREDVRKSVTQ